MEMWGRRGGAGLVSGKGAAGEQGVLWVSVCLSACLSVSVCRCLSVWVCGCQCVSVCLGPCLSVCLSVCLSGARPTLRKCEPPLLPSPLDRGRGSVWRMLI